MRSASKRPHQAARRLGSCSLDHSVALCKVPCHHTSITTSNPSYLMLPGLLRSPLQGHSTVPSGPEGNSSSPANKKWKPKTDRGRKKGTPAKVDFYILRNLRNDFSLRFFKNVLRALLNCKNTNRRAPKPRNLGNSSLQGKLIVPKKRSVRRLSDHHSNLAGKSHPSPVGLCHPHFLPQSYMALTFPTLKWCDRRKQTPLPANCPSGSNFGTSIIHFVFKRREKRKGWYSERNLRDLPEEKAQTRQQKRQHFHAAATTGDRAALQTPRSLGGFTEVEREGEGGRETDWRTRRWAEAGREIHSIQTLGRKRRSTAPSPRGNRVKGFSLSTIKKKKMAPSQTPPDLHTHTRTPSSISPHFLVR